MPEPLIEIIKKPEGLSSTTTSKPSFKLPAIKLPNLKILEDIFVPFGKPSKATKISILVIQLVAVIGIMQLTHGGLIPAPLDIFKTFWNYISGSDGFYDDFFATFMFVFRGMLYAMILTMTLTYLRPIAFFTYIVDFVTKCRYLTLSTVLIMFTMMVKGGNLSDLKMILLLFGTVPFFVNSFVEETAIGKGTPEYHLNKAFVNKMGKWEALYRVIIVGKLDRLFLVVKANFAIAWAVITTVESNAMNEGGIGTIISKSNKHMVIGELIAIALLVLCIGVLFDALYGWARWGAFPFTRKK